MEFWYKVYLSGSLFFLVLLLFLYPRSEGFKVYLRKAPLLTVVLCIAAVFGWPIIGLVVIILFISVIANRRRV